MVLKDSASLSMKTLTSTGLCNPRPREPWGATPVWRIDERFIFMGLLKVTNLIKLGVAALKSSRSKCVLPSTVSAASFRCRVILKSRRSEKTFQWMCYQTTTKGPQNRCWAKIRWCRIGRFPIIKTRLPFSRSDSRRSKNKRILGR